MLAHGNAAPPVCALNLLRTFRGEVPYVRTKGIDRALIDMPSTEAWRLRADAEWAVSSYEPRASLDEVVLGADGLAAVTGDLSATVEISPRG